MNQVFFKRIPQLLSIVCHPLLMPTIGIYIVLNSGTQFSLLTDDAKHYLLLVTALFTFGIPMAFLPIFYYQKLTSSIEMSEKRERIAPLLTTSILYYLLFYLMHHMGVPVFIQAFQLASAIAVFVTLLITYKWKISAHLVGIGGIIGLIMVLSIFYHVNMLFFLIIALLFAGFVAFARLSLNAHTPGQVYLGLAIGLLIMIGTLLIF
jgi:hypothetical protein